MFPTLLTLDLRGFWGGYVKEYIEATDPAFAIGEYWDSLAYEGGNVCYNQGTIYSPHHIYIYIHSVDSKS